MIKKFTFHFLLVLIVILPSMAQAQKPVKIGFCMATFDGDRWLKDKEHFPIEAARLGAQVEVFNADKNHNQQLAQVKEAIESGIDVLVLVPVDSEKANEIVEFAHSKGIKVISYDRLALNSKVDYYVSFDPLMVGRMEAEYAIQRRPKGNYMILKGPVKDYNAVLFAKGQMEVLDPHIKKGNIKVVYEKHLAEWGDMEAFMDLQDFLPSFNEKIDVILSTSDKTAEGAILLMESLGHAKDYLITGQGASLQACQSIQDGKLDMSVYKPVIELSALAALKAVQIARNEPLDLKKASTIHNGKFDIPSFFIQPQVIDQKNLAKLVEDGFWKQEEVFKKSTKMSKK